MNNEIEGAINTHVMNAISRVDATRFRQEPAYVNAILSRMDGIPYSGPLGHVEIKATIVDDRGPGSAESVYGADFAITAMITSDGSRVEKAILGQAKKGRIEELSTTERSRLNDQTERMSGYTDQYVVLEIPQRAGFPRIRIPRNMTAGYGQPILLQDYIVRRLLGCIHGDRNAAFVSAVQDSRLTGLSTLNISVRT